jgi:predicted O-methyltransferase YrrM
MEINMNEHFFNNYFRHTRRGGRSSLGIKSKMIGTMKGDNIFLDYAITENPHLCNFVELGTYGGFTSLFLGLMARLRNADFYTFDIFDNRVDIVKKAWLSNMFFIQDDILTNINTKVIDLISKENTFLFIDNGNKIKETNMYLDYMKKGSVIVIHDWNTEIKIEDVEDVLRRNNMKSLYEDVSTSLNSLGRCWIKEYLEV